MRVGCSCQLGHSCCSAAEFAWFTQENTLQCLEWLQTHGPRPVTPPTRASSPVHDDSDGAGGREKSPTSTSIHPRSSTPLDDSIVVEAASPHMEQATPRADAVGSHDAAATPGHAQVATAAAGAAAAGSDARPDDDALSKSPHGAQGGTHASPASNSSPASIGIARRERSLTKLNIARINYGEPTRTVPPSPLSPSHPPSPLGPGAGRSFGAAVNSPPRGGRHTHFSPVQTCLGGRHRCTGPRWAQRPRNRR